MSSQFLTAQWRQLLMLNFTVDPSVLSDLVPKGTELDSWNGTTNLSLVAFQFLDTRIKGIAVPFHRNFEEINLRFYVRAPAPEGWRRGVVFIREIVPRAAIATVARWLYNENYVSRPTRAQLAEPTSNDAGRIEYGWRNKGSWLSVSAKIQGEPSFPAENSQEEFITEHYWGYSTQRDGTTLEYQVEHPQWKVWRAEESTHAGDLQAFWGERFAGVLGSKPDSSFVADGSPVIVHKGKRLRTGVAE